VVKKMNTFLGFFAGWLSWIFGKSNAKPTTDDLRRAEFKTSTQSLGVRFTEQIRHIFRMRWFKEFKNHPKDISHSD